MKSTRVLAALAVAAVGAVSPFDLACRSSSASAAPARTLAAAAGEAVGEALYAQTITCTKAGTLWTCREGTVGNVVAQLQDYASCVVESDCAWQYVPGPGQHAGDARWFLTGVE